MQSLVVALLICAFTEGTVAEQTSRTYSRPQVSRAYGNTFKKPEPEIRYVDVIKYVERPVVKYVNKEVVKWAEKEVVKYVDRDIIRIKEPEKTPNTYCPRGERSCRLGEGTLLKHCFHFFYIHSPQTNQVPQVCCCPIQLKTSCQFNHLSNI